MDKWPLQRWLMLDRDLFVGLKVTGGEPFTGHWVDNCDESKLDRCMHKS